jgi:hypothetical protein
MTSDPFGDRPLFKEAQSLANEILDRARASSFPKGDARDVFLYRSASAINAYSLSIGLELVARELCEHADLQDDIQKLTLQGAFGEDRNWITTTLKYARARRRAHLFRDIWDVFEDPLRIMYEAIVPPAQRAGDGEHVDIPVVWKRLSKVAKRNGQTTAEQRGTHVNTVNFWSSARNATHSNTVYKGKEKAMVLANGYRAELVPGKPTDFMHPHHMPLLIRPLLEAWEYLRAGIIQTDLIPMPSCIDESAYD